MTKLIQEKRIYYVKEERTLMKIMIQYQFLTEIPKQKEIQYLVLTVLK